MQRSVFPLAAFVCAIAALGCSSEDGSGGTGGGGGSAAPSAGASNAGSPGSGAGGGTPNGDSGGSGGNANTAGRGGAPGSGGAAGAGKGGSGGGSGGSVAACGTTVTLNPNPFGCEFAWGTEGNTGNRSSYLDFITKWVGYEPRGGLDGRCDGCSLAQTLASSNARLVYYAYFIAYGATEAGFGDCNRDDDLNLCTHGAQWLRSNRANIIERYANYARMTHAASPNKGVLWLLEGDFIQYTDDSQQGTTELTMAEIGTLATDIICAIRANQPTAIIAINHSSWIRNPVLTNYFNAMPLELIDMVWTTGMGNAPGGHLNTGDANNRVDGTYAYLYNLTKKKMFVDTSFGASQQPDTWTPAGVMTLNQRITDGVIAVNVTQPPGDYQARVTSLTPQLSSVCQ